MQRIISAPVNDDRLIIPSGLERKLDQLQGHFQQAERAYFQRRLDEMLDLLDNLHV